MLVRLKMGLMVALTLSLGLLTGCSSAPSSPSVEANPDPRDPFQNLNRKVYSFNSYRK